MRHIATEINDEFEGELTDVIIDKYNSLVGEAQEDLWAVSFIDSEDTEKVIWFIAQSKVYEDDVANAAILSIEPKWNDMNDEFYESGLNNDESFWAEQCVEIYSWTFKEIQDSL
jgi:hypothetical protein